MNNSEKTKVLYIITLLSWGGAQKYVYDLISGLKDEPNLEIIISGGAKNKGELAERAKNQGLKSITFKNLVREINPLKDLLAVWEIKKTIEKEKPDIIHLNSSKAGVVGSLAAKLAKHKARVIFTCHGWVFNESLNPLIKLAYLVLEKSTSRFKDKIICLSQLDKQSALKKNIAPQNKLAVIPNGINLDKIKFLDQPEARKKLGLPLTGIIVGTIANFYANKGLKYFIEAIKIINTDPIPVVAVVIGDGELRPELENLIKEAGLENKFILAGSQSDAAQYLKAFDLYLCSSLKEGLPYSILEAMAAGLPIVATRIGGIPEIIKDGKTGLLSEPGNSAKLAEKIKQVIADPALAKKMAEQARLAVINDFSFQKMILETLSEYKK
ncbi:MAG: glycosyltransferase family 4 protein [Patescibacteria group bacterium]